MAKVLRLFRRAQEDLWMALKLVPQRGGPGLHRPDDEKIWSMPHHAFLNRPVIDTGIGATQVRNALNVIYRFVSHLALFPT